jgi:hypothetical protein
MAKIVIMYDGHMSLEYEENEHDGVRAAVKMVDPDFSVTKRISSSTLKVKGEELVSTADEMGCGLISGSSNGDNIIKEIEFILSSRE